MSEEEERRGKKEVSVFEVVREEKHERMKEKKGQKKMGSVYRRK